ncbi:hypothetical protein WOLCODRAFT_152461 [Wolfiporia cocos MD-104 SS10]|uniref:NAD(P)-binding domain-containing protein n=1 Tax=Wolfiporia cocos (strain MD-104) TaxID=742152 RepID=A0A2H3JKN9_WOLCO|nr:hypothetical protein WOLCODRAFT_152461 [Wolfiporia cocos MD-104 SS10]
MRRISPQRALPHTGSNITYLTWKWDSKLILTTEYARLRSCLLSTDFAIDDFSCGPEDARGSPYSSEKALVEPSHPGMSPPPDLLASAGFSITTLVRSPEKAAKLDKLGVRAVTGSLQDSDKLTQLSQQANIVIACADADDLAATQAVLDGLQKRNQATREVPVLIHTSGTGVFSDTAAGMYPTSTIYYDSNSEQIESLSPQQLHRNVDLAVLNADAKGAITAYFVLPSTIWGMATGPLVDQGIMNRHSQQIPSLIRASLGRGDAGMVGDGKNMWPNVNIDEVADLYILILDSVLSGRKIGHGRDGFYIGENGEHMLYDVSRAIGEAMVALGRARTNRVSTFSRAELDKYFGGSDYLGSNVRCRAERSRAIGWKPAKTTRDMLVSIRPEIERMLEHPEEVKG